MEVIRGGDLGGTGGTVPPKFEVGGPPMHWSPPIFWEIVLWDGRESSNRVKMVSSRNSFLKYCFFLVKKESYTIFYTVKIRRIWKERVKTRKSRSMTKKRSSEFLGVKMEIFPKKTSFINFGPRKILPSPQTQRQVSATGSNVYNHYKI